MVRSKRVKVCVGIFKTVFPPTNRKRILLLNHELDPSTNWGIGKKNWTDMIIKG